MDRSLKPSLNPHAAELLAGHLEPDRHEIDSLELGQYCELMVQAGDAAAQTAFPRVAAHLDAGCRRCSEDQQEIGRLLRIDDEQPMAPTSWWRRASSPMLLAAATILIALGTVGYLQYLTKSQRSTVAVLVTPIAPAGSQENPAGAIVTSAPDESTPQAPGSAGVASTNPPPPVVVAAAPTQRASSVAAVAAGYPASAGVRPIARGTCPDTHPIKGNQGSRSTTDWIYHMPGGSSYRDTDPEECFQTEAAAQAAGYRRARN